MSWLPPGTPSQISQFLRALTIHFAGVVCVGYRGVGLAGAGGGRGWLKKVGRRLAVTQGCVGLGSCRSAQASSQSANGKRLNTHRCRKHSDGCHSQLATLPALGEQVQQPVAVNWLSNGEQAA